MFSSYSHKVQTCRHIWRVGWICISVYMYYILHTFNLKIPTSKNPVHKQSNKHTLTLVKPAYTWCIQKAHSRKEWFCPRHSQLIYSQGDAMKMSRVGQNHIYGVYTVIFGREITKYMVKFRVYTGFWPTLKMGSVSTLKYPLPAV